MQAETIRLLTDLRTRKKISKSKIAEILGVDKHTVARWETGVSCPNLTDLILLYEYYGESPAKHLLELLYPYKSTTFGDPIEAYRIRAALYYLNRATDHQVRVWDYMMHGFHGSEADAQIEEFCALDHMPMHYRYFIAQQVYVFYMMAQQRGELINIGTTMPDMDIFVRGLKGGQKAAFDRLKSYKSEDQL